MPAWRWLGGVALIVAGVAAAQAPEATTTPSVVTAPIRLLHTGDIGAVPLVQVDAGGRTTWWLIDTGATVNAIAPRLAQQINARPAGARRVESIGGGRTANVVELPPLRVGGERFDAVQAVELEIDDYFARVGAEVAGILGQPFLSRQPVTFDFAQRQLVLGVPQAMAEGTVTVPLAVDSGLPVLQLSLGQRPAGRFLFDSGNPGALVLFAAGARRLLPGELGLPELTIAELGGTVTARFARVDASGAAGLALSDVPVAIEGGHRARRGGHFDRLDGSLGLAPLLNTRVTIDMRAATLSIDASRIGAVAGGFGLVLAQSPAGPVVVAVLESGPAAAAGIRPGDRLLAVDGEASGAVAALWSSLAARDEAEFRFAVAGGERTVRLQRPAFFPRLP